MSAVLADIGGTHIRFGVFANESLKDTEMVRVHDFQSFPEALKSYCNKHNTGNIRRLAIATAAWPDKNGTWRFAQEGHWPLRPKALEDEGWHVYTPLNDFEATACGAVSLPGNDRLKIRGDHPAQDSRRSLVMGPGTGLGIAYIDHGTTRLHVQPTFGAHMACGAVTDEQALILRLIRQHKQTKAAACPEDIVSGPGLLRLYHAVCQLHGAKPYDHDPATLLETDKNDPLFRHTLRLFHEFFGMTVNQAVIFGHSFRAVYLDGGLIYRLLESDLFNTELFLQAMVQDPIPAVKNKLETVPVFAVTDPYISLKGLAAWIRQTC